MAMRFIIMLLGISLSCFPMKSQDKVFFADSQFWDFGTIKEADGMVEHVFRLRNVGKAPEKIAAAIPSCTCVFARFPQTEIAPGDEADVTLYFSPSGANGKVWRSVDLTDSRGALLLTLEMCAEVEPCDESIQRRYPATIAPMIYISRTTVPFGYIAPGQSLTKAVYIANASDRGVELDWDVPEEGVLNVQGPKYLGAGKEEALLLSYEMGPQHKDRSFSDVLKFKIDGKPVKGVSLSALCLDKAEKTDRSPSLRYYPSQGKLSGRLLSRKLRGSVKISNAGPGELLISTLRLEGKAAGSSLSSGTRIPSGESVELEVWGEGEIRAELFTNDPQRPYVTITFNQ